MQNAQSMKNVLCLLLILIAAASCHRKTVASRSTASTATIVNVPTETNTPGNVFTTTPGTSPTAIIYTKPIIVVDGKGNVIAEKNLPPDASKEILNIQSARAFTPAQTKNLAYRFKYIPPRILYVPANLAKTTSRGSYYIYNKKFYYWKKTDGYFYLDENYYN